MVKRPLFVHCKFCNQPFQTFDEEKFYCNDECETREKIMTSRTSIKDSKGKKGLPILDTDSWCRCHYCGENVRKKKKKESVSVPMFCDGICRMARDLHRKQMSKTRTCRECGIDFIATVRGQAMCSESCKKIEEKRKGKEYFSTLVKPEKTSSSKPKRRISYEELNRRAEIKRLNEDWKRLSRWK